MTLDRLLVLLLSLSFLLLAPPAAAHDAGQTATPVLMLSDPKGEKSPDDPATPPDDAGLLLLSAVPEAPSPTGTDDGGGHDSLALPADHALPLLLLTDDVAAPVAVAGTLRPCARPFATGPPRA